MNMQGSKKMTALSTEGAVKEENNTPKLGTEYLSLSTDSEKALYTSE